MAKKGDVTYELRADSSKIESDLKDAESKVKKTSKDIENAAEEVGKGLEKSAKDSVSKTTNTHKRGNEEIEKSHKKSGEERKRTEQSIGAALSEIAESTCGEIGISFSKITDAIKSPVAAGAAGAAAIAGIGVAAVNTATDIDSAMNQLQASTGITAEKTAQYQQVLEGVYKNNYGDSFGEIADVIGKIRQQVGGVVDSWDPAALQGMVESAFALHDMSLGALDTESSIRAASTMMEQFGYDGQDALDLIAQGYQNGLDYSGELLDSINEYSVHFAKMGMDADDMFKIFEAGSESGAFNLDKIGDAIKEMSIRVIDRSDATIQGFSLIGLNADEMASKFAAGGDSAKEAFKETVAALASLEDPLEQNTAGVDLFGTMWEDLGPEAVTALAGIEEGAYSTGDALDEIKDIQYDDLGSQFEALKRNVEMLLVPLGEQLIPILSQIMEEILPFLIEVIEPLIGLLGELLAPLIDILSIALQPLMEVLVVLVEFLATVLTPALEVLLEVVRVVFETMAGYVLEKVGVLEGILNELVNFVSNVFAGNWSAAWENIKNIFEGIVKLFPTCIQEIIGNIQSILGSMIDFIQNVFAGNWRGAWQNLLDILHGIWDGIVSVFKAPLNAIVDAWNRLVGSIGSISVPDWVPVIGGGKFSLPTLPRLKIGMDYVPTDFYPAYLDEGEAVLTKEENAIYRRLGGIKGIQSLLGQEKRATSDLIDFDYERLAIEVARAIESNDVEMKNAILKLARLANRPVEATFYVEGEKMSRVMADPLGEEFRKNETLKKLLRGEK